MTCKKCGTLPTISQAAGEAFFNCSVDPLQAKLMDILQHEGYTARPEGDVIRVMVDSFLASTTTSQRKSP